MAPDPSLRRMTFSLYAVGGAVDDTGMLLIDSRLLDAPDLTPRILTQIQQLNRKRAKQRFSDAVMSKNWKMMIAFAQFTITPLGGLTAGIGPCSETGQATADHSGAYI